MKRLAVVLVFVCLLVGAGILIMRSLSRNVALSHEDPKELPADVVALRTAFTNSDNERDAGLETPSDIMRVDNISYGDDPQQLMDIYWPKDTEGALPTIVSFHGGGYVYGDKDRYQYYCMDLAARGFTVINPSYRLAPLNHYPDQLIDMNTAIDLALAHASTYHIDPENIFFVGDSAGAQMASQYALAVVDSAYAQTLGLTIPAFELRAVGLNCGMYKLSKDDSMAKNYLGDELARIDELDLTRKVNASYPPAFIVSSYGDFLLGSAEPFYSVLTKQGVEAELHIYGDEAKKAPGHVFHLDIRSDVGRACNDDECAFFKAHVI